MVVFEHSLNILSGDQSSSLAISTTSAQSAAFAFDAALAGYVLITVDANCFVRQGTDPTALSNGTDQILLANQTYRCWVNSGNKLAFITASGTGTAYMTPGG
jgi:hypothetical protein